LRCTSVAGFEVSTEAMSTMYLEYAAAEHQLV
jgi:hypothetical protein